jgi:transcriptional regulator with XRE-family HTH domain
MPATALAPIDNREVVRCGFCNLVQFRAPSNDCRRCHRLVETQIIEPVVPPPVCEMSAPTPPPVGFMARLPEVLRNRRLRLHLSQSDLKMRTGFTRTYISKIERGEAIPNLFSLERYAQGLGTRGSSLVARTEDLAAKLARPLERMDQTMLWHIGPTLRRFREEANKSHGQLEIVAMSLNHSHLSRVEGGHVIPKLPFLGEFAAALGQSLAALIAEIENAAFPSG